jgi:hypothetical protein
MSENVRKFEWTPQREQAAQLIAEDELTMVEIGNKVGIVARQLQRLKKEPEFAVRIEELRAKMFGKFHRYRIARKTRRIRNLEARLEKMERVIAARAQEHQNVAGGEEGLYVRQLKSIRSGKGFKTVEEYAVDTALLKEMRETEKQAAIEARQWVEKVNFSDVTDDEIQAAASAAAEELGRVHTSEPSPIPERSQ